MGIASRFLSLNRYFCYHSKPIVTRLNTMDVKLIPALDDNYMYLLIDKESKETAVVDPVEPDKVIKVINDEKLNLTTVLTTHHHWDHAGGNKSLISKVKGLSVYGGDDRIDKLTNKVGHDYKFKLGSLKIKTLFTPCHTTGHICYFVESQDDDKVVFTGDTLFVGGCGKFFEGNPKQMHTALVEILGKLPGQTKVYCGHEYTLSNMKYAFHVESGNVDVKAKLAWATDCRKKNLPTIPSTIEDELKYNPFMRVETPELQSRCQTSNGVDTMGFLRNEKDHFKAKV